MLAMGVDDTMELPLFILNLKKFRKTLLALSGWNLKLKKIEEMQ